MEYLCKIISPTQLPQQQFPQEPISPTTISPCIAIFPTIYNGFNYYILCFA